MSASPNKDEFISQRDGPLLERVDPTYADDEEGLNLLRLATIALRQRRIVFGMAFGLALAVALATLLAPRQYTSSASFATQGSKQPDGGLGSLAAQFGVAVPGSDPTQSPSFYAFFIRSRPILLQAANAEYVLRESGKDRRTTLADLYGIKRDTPRERVEATLRKLSDNSTATFSHETGLVRFSVHTPWPQISAQIAERVIEAVNQFNLQSRQTSARAERHFVEQRLNEVETELRAAENRLQDFKQTNRTFGLSSELSLERDRLTQQVTMRQQVYASLAQAYEQAKIDEVRDTPVITVLERPEVPIFADSRQVVQKVILAGLLGFLIGLLIAFLRENVATSTSRSAEDLRRMQAAARQATQKLLSPLSPKI